MENQHRNSSFAWGGVGERGKGRRFMLRKSFSNLGKLDGPGGKGKPGKRQWEKHSE